MRSKFSNFIGFFMTLLVLQLSACSGQEAVVPFDGYAGEIYEIGGIGPGGGKIIAVNPYGLQLDYSYETIKKICPDSICYFLEAAPSSFYFIFTWEEALKTVKHYQNSPEYGSWVVGTAEAYGDSDLISCCASLWTFTEMPDGSQAMIRSNASYPSVSWEYRAKDGIHGVLPLRAFGISAGITHSSSEPLPSDLTVGQERIFDDVLRMLCDEGAPIFEGTEELFNGETGNKSCDVGGVRTFITKIDDAAEAEGVLRLDRDFTLSQWPYRHHVCGPRFMVSVKSQSQKSQATVELRKRGIATFNSCNDYKWTEDQCAGGGDCFVGDRGPGGGIVFFVSNGSFVSEGSQCSPQCKHLEVAPKGWANSNNLWQICLSNPFYDPLCNQNQDVPSVLDAKIGDGLSNTIQGLKSGSLNSKLARSYLGGGKDDWFVPSLDELTELCKFATYQMSGNIGTPCNPNGVGWLPTKPELQDFQFFDVVCRGSSTTWPQTQTGQTWQIGVCFNRKVAEIEEEPVNDNYYETFKIRVIRAF